jgi:hypothetical protein
MDAKKVDRLIGKLAGIARDFRVQLLSRGLSMQEMPEENFEEFTGEIGAYVDALREELDDDTDKE